MTTSSEKRYNGLLSLANKLRDYEDQMSQERGIGKLATGLRFNSPL